jgi:hypothetical protein
MQHRHENPCCTPSSRYWSFKTNRRWAKQQQQQQQEGPEDQAHSAPNKSSSAQTGGQSNLRSQLAGLRHRAAVRSTSSKASSQQSSCAGCSSVDEPEVGGGGLTQEDQEETPARPPSVATSTASAELLEGPVPGELPTPGAYGPEYYSHIALGSPLQHGGIGNAEYGGEAARLLRRDQQQLHAATTTTAAAAAEPPDTSSSLGADAPDAVPEPHPLPYATAGGRPKFVANSEKREQVVGQLAGLRRKARLVKL